MPVVGATAIASPVVSPPQSLSVVNPDGYATLGGNLYRLNTKTSRFEGIATAAGCHLIVASSRGDSTIMAMCWPAEKLDRGECAAQTLNSTTGVTGPVWQLQFEIPTFAHTDGSSLVYAPGRGQAWIRVDMATGAQTNIPLPKCDGQLRLIGPWAIWGCPAANPVLRASDGQPLANGTENGVPMQWNQSTVWTQRRTNYRIDGIDERDADTGAVRHRTDVNPAWFTTRFGFTNPAVFDAFGGPSGSWFMARDGSTTGEAILIAIVRIPPTGTEPTDTFSTTGQQVSRAPIPQSVQFRGDDPTGAYVRASYGSPPGLWKLPVHN